MHPTLRYRNLREQAALRLRGLLEVWVILDQHVGDDDVGPQARQGERVLPAQPARGTRDHGDTTFQVEHSLPPISCPGVSETPWSRPRLGDRLGQDRFAPLVHRAQLELAL